MDKESGLIALITVLIVTFVALFVSVSGNLLNVGQAQMVLKKEKSADSFYLATACAEHALLWLKNDFDNYTGNESLSIDGGSCRIEPVVTSTSPRIVQVWAEVENKIRRIKIKASRPAAELAIESWEEVPDF